MLFEAIEFYFQEIKISVYHEYQNILKPFSKESQIAYCHSYHERCSVYNIEIAPKEWRVRDIDILNRVSTFSNSFFY